MLMALSDPQTLTIGGTATTLSRVESNGGTSTYSKDDGTVVLKASHSRGKTRTRRSVRLDLTKVVADPYASGVSRPVSMSAFVNVDVPNLGLTLAEQKDLVTALVTALTASSGALLTKILGGEN
jgi:hypothetical protein